VFDSINNILETRPTFLQGSSSHWLVLKVTEGINSLSQTKCFTVNIKNDAPSLGGPLAVSVSVRNTAILPLDETEIIFDIIDPENNPNRYIADLFTSLTWVRKSGKSLFFSPDYSLPDMTTIDVMIRVSD